MGFWKSLFSDGGGANCLPKDRGLPTSTRPPPPMPTCKPPKQPDISEPVIKLLAMLEEDVWEPLGRSTEKDCGCTSVIFGVRHIFKESLILKVKKTWYSDWRGTCERTYIYTVYDHIWMTADEREAITEKIQSRAIEIAELNQTAINKRERELYKQYLETV